MGQTATFLIVSHEESPRFNEKHRVTQSMELKSNQKNWKQIIVLFIDVKVTYDLFAG